MKKTNIFDFFDKFVNKLENMLTVVLKCKYIYYVFFFFIAISIGFLKLKSSLKIEKITDYHYINYFLVTIGISLVIFLLIITINKDKNFGIPKKFLITALLFGFWYIFLAPMFTQSDESCHFIRGYQVSEGRFVSPTDEFGNRFDDIPKSFLSTLYSNKNAPSAEIKNYEDSLREMSIPLKKSDVQLYDIRAGSYIFLIYLPQAIGMKIATLFDMSPYFIGVFGRITNYLCCVCLITLGLKLLPIGKKCMFILFLAPSIFAYNASLSADGIVLSMCFLYISMILKFIYEKRKVPIKWLILLIVVSIFVATCKIAYLPIVGIASFLPYECFNNSKLKKWLFTLFIVGLAIYLNRWWDGIYDIPGKVNETSFSIIKYIFVLFNSILVDGISFLNNIFAGNYMYQAQIKPYFFVGIVYCVILALAFFQEKSEYSARLIHRVIIYGLSAVMVFGIGLAIYKSNTQPDAIILNGVQGRYFAPLLLFLPFFIRKKVINCNFSILNDIALILNLFIITNMVVAFMC